jgi:large subunit ribosomal protein L9
MAKQKLLLINDVEDLGRSGEVVSVKPGYARNFLIPKKIAIVADPNTLKMQEKLKKERAIKSLEDKKEAEALARIIEPMSLAITVKVDTEGKMYGSVGPQDIIELFEKHNIKLSKKNIGIKKHLKEVGLIEIPIKLKEGVETKVSLQIIPQKIEKQKEEKKEEINEEIKEEKKKRTRKVKEKKEEAEKESKE